MFHWSFEVNPPRLPAFGCKIYNWVWPRLHLLLCAAAALPVTSEVMLDNFEKPSIIEMLTRFSLYNNFLHWDIFS